MTLDRKTGIVLFAEGSSREEANQAVWKIAAVVGACSDFSFVRPAFSQTTQPNLGSTIDDAVAAGIERLIIVPFYLTPSLRLQEDLPPLVDAERARYPQLDIRVTASLEGHPLLAEIILERTRQVLREIKAPTA